MKISIEIDLTPEEAREIVGLPNVGQLHEAFLNVAKNKMKDAASSVDIDPLIKTWSGLGWLAQDALSGFVGAALRPSTSGVKSESDKSGSKKAKD
ncbi:MAG: DUF6489 family protein [Pseudomonadota bacterium]